MEIDTMGKVVVAARIENIHDLKQTKLGNMSSDQVRRVEVADALVDTGATMLSMPARLIQQLGLDRVRTRRAWTAAGTRDCGVYETIRLTVEGRDCAVEVIELPGDCPVLIGQVPLELLDFIVDPVNHRLLGNPEHNGEHMYDLF